MYLSCNNAEILFSEEDNSDINVLNMLIEYINIIYNKIYQNGKDIRNLKYEELINYFSNLELNSKLFYYTYGDMYLLIRKYIRIDDNLNKYFLFYEDIKFYDPNINNNDLKLEYKKIEQDIAKTTKKDIIGNWRNNIIEHTVKEINDDFFKKYFQKQKINSIEYNVLDLIALTNILILNEASEYYKYELYVYLCKLIENLQNKNKIKTNSILDGVIENKLNEQMIEDLKISIKYLKDNILFDPLILSENYPEFIFLTRYDNLFKNNNIKPYRTQIEVIVNIIYSNIKEKFDNCGNLITLKSITGEGKTTLAIPLAILANKIKHHSGTNFNNKKLEVIYCCNSKLKSNMIQIINNAKAINLPFAVACTGDNDQLNIKILKKNNTTISKDKRLLIVADIKSTALLLKKAYDKNNNIGQVKTNGKIEYGKEFILFFDEPTAFLDSDDIELSDLYNILKYMPINTILASATLPENNLLEKLKSYYLTRYNNRYYKLIISENSQIGSEIYDFSGKIYLTNQNINSFDEFNKIIDKVKYNLFIKKIYTPFTTSLLWNKIYSLYKQEPPKINLDNIDNFKVKYINPSQINQKNIESTALSYLNKINNDHNQENLSFFNEINHSSFSVTLTKLYELKKVFISQTLIITKEPISFIKQYFSNEINSLLKNINNKFNKQYESMNDFISNIQLFDISDLILQNNDVHHKLYDPRIIDWNNLVLYDNNIIIALLLGIGIYDPEYENPEYIKTIIKLSNKGMLSYVISNTDISYGTNFKIEYIIIDNTCFKDAENHSINTLFQLISRAGRRGISWKASIYCDSNVINIIKNFCKTNILTIEDNKFNEILEKLFKEFNVTLIDTNNDTLFDVLNEDPLININKNNQTINSIVKNDYLDITSTKSEKLNELNELNELSKIKVGGNLFNYNNFINPTLPNKIIKLL